jgi:Fe-S-cluster containining protein
VKTGEEGANNYSPVQLCRRCGICCKKGGPSFHSEDKFLIEEGFILSKYLYTIRIGERVYDNVKGRLLPTDSEIIKIRGKNGTWTCVFFDERENRCDIYENRPTECRVLKCWDTREIEKIYCKNRLTRKELLSEVKGLWELIEDHESRCSHLMLNQLLKEADIRKEEIRLMLAYDKEIHKALKKLIFYGYNQIGDTQLF